MRALPPTLSTAQKAGTLNSLYKIVLTSGSTSYTYDKERILPSKHDEEVYSHTAEIVLHNRDGALDDLDFKGYEAVLSYGAKTTIANEYSDTASLFVIDQQYNSDPNNLTCTLFLEGIPNLMARDEASENYEPDEDDETIVKDLVDAIAGATLDCFSQCEAFDILWEVGYDDLADSYMPKDAFRIYAGTSRLAAFRKALDYTANVPIFKADGKIHIVKPTTSGDTHDYEYSLDRGDHHFFSKAYRDALVFPNKIFVKSKDDDDPQYLGSAQINTYNSLPDKLKKIHYVRTRLESNDQADDIAEALITKAEMGSARGQAEVPMNVGAEIFDYIQVTDSRQGDTRTGNIGFIHRRFGGEKNKWEMTFGFGNWLEYLRYQKLLKELETYTDVGNYFSRLQVGDLYVENILADNLDFVWIDPDGNIDLSLIGDTLDGLADGATYGRVLLTHLDASGIKISAYTVFNSGYDPTDKFDLTGNDLDDILDGTSFQRVQTAALTAAGLVLLDQVVVGTYGLVLTTDISAGHILLSKTTKDGEWYDESGVAIDATSGIYAYGTLAAFVTSGIGTAITSFSDAGGGEVQATSASHGLSTGDYVRIRGTDYYNGSYIVTVVDANNFKITATWEATETGYVALIQTYVGSDGAIYGGAGKVLLNALGLYIKGQYVFIQDTDGVTRGHLFGADNYVRLQANNDLEFTGLNNIVLDTNILLPVTDDHINIGSISKQYSKGYLKTRLKIPVGTDLYD